MTSTQNEKEDKEHRKPKTFEDVELQALLDEMIRKYKRKTRRAIGLCQQAVSDRPRGVGKIQKTGRWVPH